MRTLLFLWHLLLGWGGLIVGGIYGVIRGFDELLKAVDALRYRFRDYTVFEVIDEPLVFPTAIKSRLGPIKSLNPAPRQYGYTPKDISERLKRKESSVLKSLKRLKRCDKAVETMWGWYSTRTAPKD